MPLYIPTVADCVLIAKLMIQEVEQEAKYVVTAEDRIALYSKRDALEEFCTRLAQKMPPNPFWARSIPNEVGGGSTS